MPELVAYQCVVLYMKKAMLIVINEQKFAHSTAFWSVGIDEGGDRKNYWIFCDGFSWISFTTNSTEATGFTHNY